MTEAIDRLKDEMIQVGRAMSNATGDWPMARLRELAAALLEECELADVSPADALNDWLRPANDRDAAIAWVTLLVTAVDTGIVRVEELPIH